MRKFSTPVANETMPLRADCHPRTLSLLLFISPYSLFSRHLRLFLFYNPLLPGEIRQNMSYPAFTTARASHTHCSAVLLLYCIPDNYISVFLRTHQRNVENKAVPHTLFCSPIEVDPTQLTTARTMNNRRKAITCMCLPHLWWATTEIH